MTESDPIAAPAEHEHDWQLSVEYDSGVEIRERLCTSCSAVLIDD